MNVRICTPSLSAHWWASANGYVNARPRVEDRTSTKLQLPRPIPAIVIILPQNIPLRPHCHLLAAKERLIRHLHHLHLTILWNSHHDIPLNNIITEQPGRVQPIRARECARVLIEQPRHIRVLPLPLHIAAEATESNGVIGTSGEDGDDRGRIAEVTASASGGGAVVSVVYGSDDNGCDEGECDEEVGKNLDYEDRETARSRGVFVARVGLVGRHLSLWCSGGS